MVTTGSFVEKMNALVNEEIAEGVGIHEILQRKCR